MEKMMCVRCQTEHEQYHLIAGYDPTMLRVVVLKFCDPCFKRMMERGREMAAAPTN